MTNLQNSMSQPIPTRVPLNMYDPLPGENYIRTATILPGKAEDVLVVALVTVPLLKSEPVEYTALSYAWGSAEEHIEAEIRVINNNLPGIGQRQIGRLMRVGKNLGMALRDLRREESPRTMWIDALCIDQGNSEEKAVQVSKIGDIFQLAANVVAYIGPEADESVALMEYLEHIGKGSEYNWKTGILNVAALRHEWKGMRLIDDYDNLLIDAQLQDSIYQLFSRPWFERLWIRQEITLGGAKAMITCGRYELPWRFFLRAWTCLYVHFSRTDSLQPHYLRKLWQISSLLEQQRLASLHTLRDTFRGLKCTDQRDRLFAVLEMLPKDEKRLISVNYTKVPAEVYKDATLGWIEAHRDLSILQECELQDGWAGPTWVPNWGADSQVDIRARMGFQTSRLTAILDLNQAVKNGSMRVVGVKITTIADLRPSGIDLDSPDILAKLRDLLGGIQMEGDYVAGGTLREAYATALVRGKFPTATEPISYGCSSITDVVEAMQWACSASPSNILPLTKESMVDMRLFWAHRQLFRGSSGYVGMAPPATRIGDRVYNILGCDCPLVLRDVGERKMQVVGSCFVSGAMENQALLGPLPTEFEATYIKASGSCLGFRDRLTKEATYNDPRLPKLSLTDEYKAYLYTLKGAHAFGISLETLHRFNSEVRWVEIV
jgi:hypothetical protein